MNVILNQMTTIKICNHWRIRVILSKTVSFMELRTIGKIFQIPITRTQALLLTKTTIIRRVSERVVYKTTGLGTFSTLLIKNSILI
jgi:hypothetical protein